MLRRRQIRSFSGRASTMTFALSYTLKTAYLASLAIILTLMFFGESYSAVSPFASKLMTVETPAYPGLVAADQAGTIYAGDYYGKAVYIFESDGSNAGLVSLPGKPTSMAVSPEGLLFVGQRVADAGFIGVYRHGNGPGAGIVNTITGFSEPRAIAFISGEGMYVIDGHLLRKFNPSMAQVQEYGGVGAFIEPESLAVNAGSGEVYVLDRGQMTDSTRVWRVQVFSAADITAGPLRSFSNFGFDTEGKVGSASSLAVDTYGRAYISDNAQNILAVFDTATGAYLSTIVDGSATLNPLRLDFNASGNRLYIASGSGKYISVFGIDSFAVLSLSPSALSVRYQAGAGDIRKTVTLTNTGNAAMNWTAGSDVGWLTVSGTGGELKSMASQQVEVTLQASGASGFIPGSEYTGNITVQYNGGTKVIPVTVVMVGPPVISVTPDTVNITKKIGEAPLTADVTVTVSNDVSGAISPQAATDADWLTVAIKAVRAAVVNDITTTVATVEIGITASPESLVNKAPGTYSGKIYFSAPETSGSPATLTVNLTLLSEGRVTVTTDNKEAAFTIRGPAGVFRGRGLSYSVDSAVPGEYSVVFEPVSGFRTPATLTGTLVAGQELVINARYTDLRRKMNIIASHGAGPYESSEIAVFGSDGTLIHRFTPFAFRYGANTAVGDLDGNGMADILVGSGGGNRVPAAVKGFHRDGSPISGLAFTAFKGRGGVAVAAGDFDGDHKDEIVAGDASHYSSVRIFSYDAGEEAVTDTGVLLEVYPENAGGVNVAAADVDGDGRSEVITSPRRGTSGQEIRIFRINRAGGPGNWIAEPYHAFAACRYPGERLAVAGGDENSINVSTGDISGDGIAEIIAVCTAAGGAEVTIYNAAGDASGSFSTGMSRPDFIAAGDLTMDGIAEIVLGSPLAGAVESVRIMDGSGQIRSSFVPFSGSWGVKVTVGDLGY